MAYHLPRYKVTLVREGSYGANHNITRSAEDVHALMSAEFAEVAVESVKMLALDTKNKVIGVFDVSSGSLSASIVHPRDIFQRAILSKAASVIIVHNHPSGDPAPSPEDVALTTRLAEAGKIFDIPVLDHIVIGEGQYTSLKEKGLV